MNTPVDQSGSDAENTLVSAIYRRAADEKAPDRLNHAILHRARKSDARSPTKFWQAGWLQPIALVAVVGLSLTLILDINDLVDAENPAVIVNQANDSLERATEDALKQIRNAESLAQQNPGVTDSGTPPVMLEQSDPGISIQDTDLACSATQRATTARWWQCIQSLERRGHTDAATVEYEELFSAYPAFRAP